MSRVKCHCGGRPSCRLCGGARYFTYLPGPRGWLPFACPGCDGTGWRREPGIDPERCPTCRGEGTVDPADPPLSLLVTVRKALFGG